MNNDIFEAESLILKNAEALLQENPDEPTLYKEFQSIIADL